MWYEKGGLNGGKVHFKFNWKKHFGENEVLDTTNLLHLVRKISAKLGVFHISGKKKITALQVSFLFLFSNIFSPKNWMAISDTSNKKHAEVRIDSSSTYPLTYPPRNEGLIKGLLRLTSHNTWSGKDNYLQLK